MKQLHMIGFSHIDPVWFWDRVEGLQEARATFSAVLDRIGQFPDFRFTCTSAALFDFIRHSDPGLFARLQEAVAQGRIEITGGWWVEPDCHLPSGESLLRQGLYGQQFFQEAFGQKARIGGNVDSFGHSPMLPQLLLGCGMDRYYFMRPRLSARVEELGKAAVPLVHWQSPDGSQVLALSLPGEYTCWFEETLKENIERSLEHLAPYPSLPCFYGVGNHGGGPTIANIQAVDRLRPQFPQVKMEFSTLGAFFDQVQALDLPVLSAYLEGVNTGCYSIDHRFKQAMRGAEQALLRAERLNAMAVLLGSPHGEQAAVHEALWKRLLFCQFHDTLGGTSIKAARDNALQDMGGVTAQAEDLAHLALTRLSLCLDTRGEGYPLLLVNDSAQPFEGLIDLEIPWFCKDPLAITDEQGQELPYQLAKTHCTMRWYRLGGRRRTLFKASIPAFGHVIYRAHIREARSLYEYQPQSDLPFCLENQYLKASFDEQGHLYSLVDKASGYESLNGPVVLDIWHDQRDSWGHGKEGRLHASTGERQSLLGMRFTQQGPLRSTLLIQQASPTLRAELEYTLDHGAKALRLELRLLWDGPWKALKLCLPLPEGEITSSAESAYARMQRGPSATAYYMHRFVDTSDAMGAGLALVNKDIYGFSLGQDKISLDLLRSAIFAHGDCVGWENDHDRYAYNDLGGHAFSFLLLPHGRPLEAGCLPAHADLLHAPPLVLADYARPGLLKAARHSLLDVDNAQIHLGAFKPAQDGQGLILRLHETEGQACQARLRLGEQIHPLSFRAHEIKTLRLFGGLVQEQNMLEESGHSPIVDEKI